MFYWEEPSLEKVFGEKQSKFSAEQLLDRNLAQQDWEMVGEAAEGYSDANREEIDAAHYRNQLRSVVFDPDVMKSARELGLSPEQVVNAVVNKRQDLGKLRGKKAKEFLADLVGIELSEEKPGDPFYEPGRISKPHPANVARAREAAKKSKGGTDSDLDAVLGALLGWD